MKIRKVKKSSLIVGLIVIFIFAIFIGTIGISRGLGSIYPQLNLVVRPFVCSNQHMTYTQSQSQIGSDTYWSATWFCQDESDNKIEIESNKIISYAGAIYGIIFFAILLIIIYLYWNSNIGPAKNDGLLLW